MSWRSSLIGESTRELLARTANDSPDSARAMRIVRSFPGRSIAWPHLPTIGDVRRDDLLFEVELTTSASRSG